MELLYDHYGDTLYGIVFRMVNDEAVAQDIIQEGFVKIWQHSLGYDPGKGRLFTWVLSIVRNLAIDAIRKNKRSPEIHRDTESVTMRVIRAPHEDAAMNHDIEVVLSRLDEQNRSLIEHSYILGYTHPEIAEKFAIPIGTVKTRIRRAMNDLRNIFGNGHA